MDTVTTTVPAFLPGNNNVAFSGPYLPKDDCPTGPGEREADWILLFDP